MANRCARQNLMSEVGNSMTENSMGNTADQGQRRISMAYAACPWHGWQYGVKSGVNTMKPQAKVYQVKVEGGRPSRDGMSL